MDAMFCRKCYWKLEDSQEFHRCPRCEQGFDPTNPRTYLRRPFPGPLRILWEVILTTVVGTLVALIVATFQMAKASGH